MILYLDDVRSDFSVFHRVDDIESLSAERFFAFAERLMAYEGAVRFTAQTEERESQRQYSPTPNASPSASASSSDGKKYYRDIKHNLELAEYFD